MTTMTLRLPTLMSIVATRAMLAFGAGLLVSERLSPARRRAIGMALVGGGIASTVPVARWMRQAARRGRTRGADTGATIGRDERLVGMTRFPRRGDDESAG